MDFRFSQIRDLLRNGEKFLVGFGGGLLQLTVKCGGKKAKVYPGRAFEGGSFEYEYRIENHIAFPCSFRRNLAHANLLGKDALCFTRLLISEFVQCCAKTASGG
ncbi:hypothetical protein PIN31009_03938 [Pandoraea iniqua]|uniref:Uncharacterized protein n=1 Tax=Pandoraea iniqua TaxID=2508288 RepID=A0A5E4XM18_9BURK|nr:hypothetical protein PIN31009_03938 [Pandoraea iniqua]VVE43202.1 hypothetical protein PIN31115_04240 [Pandoraea iniqua]